MVSGGPQPPPRSRLALTLLPGSQAALELCGEEAGLLGGGAGIPGSSLRLGRRPSPPAPLTGHGVYPRGHTWPLPWPGSEPRGRKGNQAAPGAPGVPLLPSHPHAPTGRMEKVRLGRRRRPQGPGGASPPPPTLPSEEGGQLKRRQMAQIPGFRRDAREQDLLSQLLSQLKIFTSKYVPMRHIFASSQPGSLSPPPGRRRRLGREGLAFQGS